MTKIDPYKHEQGYKKWKEKVKEEGISEISKINSNLLLSYVFDMEDGINISVKNVKGSRSYSRLNSLKQRMVYVIKKFEEIYGLYDITKIQEEQLIAFFSRMRKGEIKRLDGEVYKSIADFVKIFKAFWHWHQKVNRKRGNGDIPDITIDLDTKYDKPKWVYLTESQIRKLGDNAIQRYKVLIWFLFDSGIRSPSELINIKVSDLSDDCKELNIRDEISKTFGRRIKLLLCSELIKEHIKIKNLSREDYVFPITPQRANEYLKRLSKKCFGDVLSEAGKEYSKLTLYDFRHCSCCYWLPRYKSESALKYRFGWKKSDKIHYYSELLGMKDTISEDDLLIDTTKTELEQRVAKAEKENEILRERMRINEEKLKEMAVWIERIKEEIIK